MLTTVNLLLSYTRGIKLIFTGDHISIEVAFKDPNVTLGLRKCNYSLTRSEELYIWPFEGNHEADETTGENEFGARVLNCMYIDSLYPFHTPPHRSDQITGEE